MRAVQLQWATHPVAADLQASVVHWNVGYTFFFFSNQMVSIRRVSGLKNPAEMTYYIQHNGVPLPGTSAAKVLNTVDSQTMALTLGYFVQLQAEREHSILL